MIYAYGFCEPATAAVTLGRRGLGGTALRAIESGGVAAVYSRHRTLRPRPIPAMVLAHERVVEAIMARGTVLPLRFGTELAREEQMAGVIADRHDDLLTSLARLCRKAEVGIRVTCEPPSQTRPATQECGRDFLHARARERRRAEAVVRELHEPLSALSRASRLRRPPTPPAILVATYLVDAERVGEFRRSAAELARWLPAVRVMVTGPWPPYSFVDVEPR